MTELNWIALGTIGTFLLAIAAFVTLYVQGRQFRKMRTDENERAFKNSSVQLITDFDRQFRKLDDLRSEASDVIVKNNVLKAELIEDYSALKDIMCEVYDFFDTLGFYVENGYIKPEVVHQYFYHWFEHYYEFFTVYNIKKLSGYNETVWIHLPKLSIVLNEVEIRQLGKERKAPTKQDLLAFFEEEATFGSD